ncbi:single-stranded DNA-binding protein [Clostridiisalibacter paucivorans]|uniref:single-stranded DNA-binding protein n=1 Tax=Clostridiisalibacter paucivorans TaxID=408753 RepID=UPI00047A44F4|nr:single-stranded DNA-binding protein [Clostridiisalibacter paucivorans]
MVEEDLMSTNSVKLVGKIVSDLKFSHEMYGEGFYNFTLKVPRLSQYSDVLPVTVSERLLVDLNLDRESYIVIEGQLRSYNRYIKGNNKLILTIFARDIDIPDADELDDIIKKPNEIYLDGFICKEPVYRTTPFGREITDLLIAVNRPYNKSDYIPAIAWGRNAKFCDKLIIGDHIKLWGRIQSRGYQKKLSDGSVINKTAYEVSISKLEYIKDDNNRVEEE